ncbi:MAG: hypothetical protein AB7G88_01700, partial [Thermomicrobiales bacterium]
PERTHLVAGTAIEHIIRDVNAVAIATPRQRVFKFHATDYCTAEFDEAVVSAGTAVLHVDE